MVIERTICDCKKCKAGCRTMPGYLAPSDLPHFQVSDLQASEGAVVVKDGQTIRLPSIVPKQRQDGSCVFLDDSGGCTVHEHSPYGCRMFNSCEPDSFRVEVARQEGLIELYDDLLDNGPYAQLHAILPPARPRAERKAAFARAIKKIERAARQRTVRKRIKTR